MDRPAAAPAAAAATTPPAGPPGSGWQAHVIAVSLSPDHGFSKLNQGAIELVAGVGVAGDAHCGATVKHRSRVARDPSQPNLRQVHLLQVELLAELALSGFALSAGQIGENITTGGIDLLALPTAARLHIGRHVVVQITGLRNPCAQLDRFAPGLMAAVLDRAADGRLIRKAGVMGVVVAGGVVRPNDAIGVTLPPAPHRPLAPV